MNIHFGIVGCGYVAQRHAKHISNHLGANLVGGYDVQQHKADDLADSFNVHSFTSLAQILSNNQIDIVNICTPNGTHHEVAVAALNAGKHVLVEKPMAIKKSYCEDMINAALNNGKQLFVVKQNRFNPPVQAVKKLIDLDKLGKIYSVVVNCYWNRNDQYYLNSDWKGSKKLDGGTLFTQFSHFIDIVYYLFGDMNIVSAITQNVSHGDLIEFEDTGLIHFQMKDSGALGSLNYTTSCFQKNMEGSITVFAENATIKMGGQYLNTVEYQETKGFNIEDLPESNAANNYGYYQGSMSNHDKIIHNVVQTMNGREKIMTNAYEGLKVVEIIENMYNLAS